MHLHPPLPSWRQSAHKQRASRARGRHVKQRSFLGRALGCLDLGIQVVKPARLIGTNRRYVESKLPHLGRLLAREPGEALSGAEVAIVSSNEQIVLDALLRASPRYLIDLCGRLGSDVEALPGYEGLGW